MNGTGAVWQCPQCSRSFSRVGQVHSCENLPVEAHFQESEPHVKKLYKNLVAQIERFGPLTVHSVKNEIELQRNVPFCSLKPRKRHLLVELMGDRNLTDPNIVKISQPAENRFVYTFHISRPEDLNQKVLSWFKRAYQLA